MNSNPKKLIAVAKMALNRCDHPLLPQNDKERIQFAIRSLQLALKNQPEIHYELAKIYHLYTNNYENAEFHAIRAGNSEKAISLLVEILKSNNKPKAAMKVVQNALSDHENVSSNYNIHVRFHESFIIIRK
jgi:tetratricopeptide (TPR) repeat protein